jgi:hypothetical protein
MGAHMTEQGKKSGREFKMVRFRTGGRKCKKRVWKSRKVRIRGKGAGVSGAPAPAAAPASASAPAPGTAATTAAGATVAEA